MTDRGRASTAPDILLLTIDALRADRLGCYGSARGLTPAIDEWAAGATVFRAAHSRSPHTPESFPALFGSVCPLSAEATNARGLGRRLPAAVVPLAEALKRSGYATAAIGSNPYVSRAFGYDRGFDQFDDNLRFGTSRLSVQAHRVWNVVKSRAHLSAEDLNSRAFQWAESTDRRPFFLWLHYMDVHGPYQPPAADAAFVRQGAPRPGLRELAALWRRAKWHPDTIAPDAGKLLSDMYDAEVRHTDRNVGNLLREFRRRGLLDNAIVALTSDHGEEFGEHGKYDHPNELYEELLRVPFIVSAPGVPGRVEDGLVPSSDLAPTLMHLAGLKPEASHQGQALLASGGETLRGYDHLICEVSGEQEDEGLRKFAVVTPSHKLEVCFRGEQVERSCLRDFAADPDERHDVAAGQPEVAARLRTLLDVHLHDLHSACVQLSVASQSHEELTEEVEDRLRDLGYIE